MAWTRRGRRREVTSATVEDATVLTPARGSSDLQKEPFIG